MAIGQFLKELFESGRVTVAEAVHPPQTHSQELGALLPEFDAIYRRQLPGGLPPLDLDAARYGAMTLYRACQFLVYRNFTADEMASSLVIPPLRPNPAEHLSVDLVLHFLPDVVRLARAAAPEDPLVKRLLELAQRWPLSSVGIAGVGAVDIEPLVRDAALFRHYVDRVIACGDASRLADGRVLEAVRASVGAFAELAGPLAGDLQRNAAGSS